jgi:hypothetical protein
MEFFNLKENYEKLKEEYVKVVGKNKKLKENIKVLQDKSVNMSSNSSDNAKMTKVNILI